MNQYGIPPELAAKKTGRISEISDQAYISKDLCGKQMTQAIYGNKEAINEISLNQAHQLSPRPRFNAASTPKNKTKTM